MNQPNPINPFEAPEGWHAVEPPAGIKEDTGGACRNCGAHSKLANGSSFRAFATCGINAPCLPKNRKDGRFVYFQKGPPAYGNEEDE